MMQSDWERSRVLPLLRSVAVVEGMQFPEPLQAYFTNMLATTQYQPLPRIKRDDPKL